MVKALRGELGKPALPHRSAPAQEAEPQEALGPDRWVRRLTLLFSRHAPRHHFRFTLTELDRQVIPAGAPPCSFTRRLLTLDGNFTAASRRGDEVRDFSFHAPEATGTADELRAALEHAGLPRERPSPCGDGDTDVVLADGCAAVLFHEILTHPLESPARSPLALLKEARLAVSELDVRDDATRLDLFGGYERDDEGVSPRPVKLLDAGRLAGQLTDRAAAAPRVSNGHGRRPGPGDAPLVRGANIVVAPGHASTEEMARRLNSGLWIERFDGGSIELASGRFRLRFPRARRVRRGRLADECGPGVLAGDVVAALKSVEPALGREARVYRPLGWCARGGQVVPVQGAAPDVLLRRLPVRSAL